MRTNLESEGYTAWREGSCAHTRRAGTVFESAAAATDGDAQGGGTDRARAGDGARHSASGQPAADRGPVVALWGIVATALHHGPMSEKPSEVFDLKPTSEKFRDSVESRTWRQFRNC
jgi:hypothetical protein